MGQLGGARISRVGWVLALMTAGSDAVHAACGWSRPRGATLNAAEPDVDHDVESPADGGGVREPSGELPRGRRIAFRVVAVLTALWLLLLNVFGLTEVVLMWLPTEMLVPFADGTFDSVAELEMHRAHFVAVGIVGDHPAPPRGSWSAPAPAPLGPSCPDHRVSARGHPPRRPSHPTSVRQVRTNEPAVRFSTDLLRFSTDLLRCDGPPELSITTREGSP